MWWTGAFSAPWPSKNHRATPPPATQTVYPATRSLYRAATGARQPVQLYPPASLKMLDTLPTASRSRVAGLVAGARPARTSGWARESSTGNDSRSGRVPFSRGHQLCRVGSSRA